MTGTANTPTVTIREKIATTLAEIAPTVETRVIDTLVEKEVARRSDLIVKGLDKLAGLQHEHHKINRADQTSYNGDGSVAASTFSKPRLDEIKKSSEQIEKFEKALNKALAGELGDLSNLVNK